MSNDHSSLHPQLAKDCHCLGSLDSGTLLLSRNARLHWFILVPDSTQADLLDLPATQLHAVMADCSALSAFLKHRLGYPKVNFAGIGNVVPQLHLHIVGRKEGDACWPKPVWGQLPEGKTWDSQALEQLVGQLAEHCNLQVDPA